jgi:hypothetical protein
MLQQHQALHLPPLPLLEPSLLLCLLPHMSESYHAALLPLHQLQPHQQVLLRCLFLATVHLQLPPTPLLLLPLPPCLHHTLSLSWLQLLLVNLLLESLLH